MKPRIKVTINGQVCTGRAGQTLLEIAEHNGIAIPNLCHNGELKHYGGCSLCVVEAEGSPKLLRACSTEAQDGQVIYTESERVVRTRKTSIELLMSDHDGDCRGPCVLNCPASVNAQGYIQAIARGDDKEAVRILKERLPIPASIGRVCPHPCEGGCRRQMVEEPISISYLKYFAADRVIAQGGYLPPKAAATGKRVGIIGGGPGGLTAAYYLSLKGHRVTIVDAMPQMGGMLRYGIPEYRLPKKVLDEEIAEIASLGVEMKNNFRIGVDATFEEFKSRYDAVVVAIGAWSSTPLNPNPIPTASEVPTMTELRRVSGWVRMTSTPAINMTPVRKRHAPPNTGAGTVDSNAANLGTNPAAAIRRPLVTITARLATRVLPMIPTPSL